jgi:hypothetical protein
VALPLAKIPRALVEAVMKVKPKFANRVLRVLGRLLWECTKIIAVIVIVIALVGFFFVIIPLFLYLFLAVGVERMVNNTSLLFQAVVLLILFPVLVLFVRDFISEERVRAMMSFDYRHILGEYYPVGFPVLFIAISLPYFAGLSCTLKSADLVATVPNFPVQDNCVVRYTGFYIWHLLDSIPLIEIPQTIRWTVPHDYTDSLSGFILLIFKIMVILPVIKAFVIWRKVTTEVEKKEEAKKSGSGDTAQAEQQAPVVTT